MNWLVQPKLLPDELSVSSDGAVSSGDDACLSGMSIPTWHRGVLTVVVSLVLLIIFSYDLPYLKANGSSAVEFVWSANFLFFCGAAICLSQRSLSGFKYEFCVFALAVIYLFYFYGDYLLLVHMSGDSVCQVAYWNILFRPHLTGSIGVAFAKPGQVVLLGILNQLSLFGGHIVFKIGLCLIMGACVWSLVAVATELGGAAAGVLAFFLSLWAFETDFVFSGSAIYAITTVFSGLRLYYYHPRWKSLGRLLLVLSLQFRIEAVAVVAVVWLIHLARREWRDMVIVTAWGLVSLMIFVGIIFRIQGSFDRLNSGAAVGYVGPVLGNGQTDASIAENPIHYIAEVIAEDFAKNYYLRFLLTLTLVGIAGAFSFARRYYLSVLSSLVIVVANVFFLGGTFNLERYCDLVYAFGCSIGAGTLVRYADCAIQRKKLTAVVVVAILVVVLMAGFDFSRLNSYRDLDPASTSEPFVSAMAILTDENIPAEIGLMTEDDLLSHLVVIAPDHYPVLTSLQLFNVVGEQKRKEILSRTDYIWFDLNGFPYYYLFHLPQREWGADPFRLMVQAILENRRQSFSMYGFRFIPVDISFSSLLLKVEH